MAKEDIICKCKGVTKGDVKKALKNGATTYKEVKKETGAGSKCGKCKKKIKKYIEKHL